MNLHRNIIFANLATTRNRFSRIYEDASEKKQKKCQLLYSFSFGVMTYHRVLLPALAYIVDFYLFFYLFLLHGNLKLLKTLLKSHMEN
jgi:hypothetical protein